MLRPTGNTRGPPAAVTHPSWGASVLLDPLGPRRRAGSPPLGPPAALNLYRPRAQPHRTCSGRVHGPRRRARHGREHSFARGDCEAQELIVQVRPRWASASCRFTPAGPPSRPEPAPSAGPASRSSRQYDLTSVQRPDRLRPTPKAEHASAPHILDGTVAVAPSLPAAASKGPRRPRRASSHRAHRRTSTARPRPATSHVDHTSATCAAGVRAVPSCWCWWWCGVGAIHRTGDVLRPRGAEPPQSVAG